MLVTQAGLIGVAVWQTMAYKTHLYVQPVIGEVSHEAAHTDTVAVGQVTLTARVRVWHSPCIHRQVTSHHCTQPIVPHPCDAAQGYRRLVNCNPSPKNHQCPIDPANCIRQQTVVA
ncbi:MAG TPA: hypothetical protein DEF43_18430 [Chloroflexus aurantiacus]|uniref:Uncharacterized protein n=1 Tax=Chloroflexus aurantiacus (strain ATCC 29366 / DSM 635 / J-10-fl) TaxID=324602 RepID=A9WEU0_CHLAA|nr:hypothetical protein Caur_0609 [Chloroflexus aurantiacus J-10-fl]RMG51542.1 MAG: hypothetical protein D6716_05680 [Chloroflexota bacterium]HBW69084.1 hypothetical protein [Chloroflexus aurantiacus]